MKNLIIILSLLFSTVSVAQKHNIVNASIALRNAQKAKGDDIKTLLKEAKEYIDQAYNNESTSYEAKMWMYRYQVYLEISQKHPEIDNASIVKATVSIIKCLQKGKKDKIIIKRWRAKEDVLSDLNVCASILFNEAGKAYENKNYSYAIELYNKIFDLIPYDEEDLLKRNNITSETIYLNCFYSSKQKKDVKMMKMYLQKLIDLNYNDPLIYSEMSKISLNENDTVNAINYINQGRELFDNDEGLINQEINFYLMLDKTDELILKSSSAIENDPNNENYYVIRANCYEISGNIQNALNDYLSALEINPNEIRALNNISSIYLKLTEPLVKKSNDLDINQTKLYDKYEKEIDELFLKALPYLETLVKLKPEDISTLTVLSEIYYKLEIFNEKSKDITQKLNILKSTKPTKI